MPSPWSRLGRALHRRTCRRPMTPGSPTGRMGRKRVWPLRPSRPCRASQDCVQQAARQRHAQHGGKKPMDGDRRHDGGQHRRNKSNAQPNEQCQQEYKRDWYEADRSRKREYRQATKRASLKSSSRARDHSSMARVQAMERRRAAQQVHCGRAQHHTESDPRQECVETATGRISDRGSREKSVSA